MRPGLSVPGDIVENITVGGIGNAPRQACDSLDSSLPTAFVLDVIDDP
jgi:hypothetical protein